MLGNHLSAAGSIPLPPLGVLALCVLAGVATVLLLPGAAEASIRKIGGAVLIASGLILVSLLLHQTIGQDRRGLGVYFWIFSAIALASAVRVITHPRPVYSALYFVLTVLASAGLFLLLWAEFVAAALVLIYAGAILITYVFVIMLASSAQTPGSKPGFALTDYDAHSREPLTAACIGFALMGVLLFLIFDKAQGLPKPAVDASAVTAMAAADDPISGSTQTLGTYLFNNQLVNLELAGLILTVSMVGAIVIARRRVPAAEGAYEPTAETVTADLTPLDDSPGSIPVYGTKNPRQKAYPQT